MLSSLGTLRSDLNQDGVPVCAYLSGDDDDLQQLQDQFERLAALGVIFITRAHEEILQLPAEGLLLLVRRDPVPGRRRGKAVVAMVTAVVVVGMLVLAAAPCGAVVCRGGRRPFLLCWDKKKKKKTNTNVWFLFALLLSLKKKKNKLIFE